MAPTTRQPGPRRAARRRRPPPGRLPRWLLLDALLALGLAACLAVPLVWVATTPGPDRRFALDRPPTDVILGGFYEPERNAEGPYRWAKGEAAILVPVARPGRYRVALTVQDGLARGPGQAATLYINGRASPPYPLAAAPGDYAATYDLDLRGWLARGQQLQLELASPATNPPGDPRALGVVVRAVAITPVGPRAPDWGILIAPPLLLVAAYAALRALDLGPRAATALVGALTLGLGAALVREHPRALLEVYLPLVRPWRVAAALGAVGAVPALAWAAAWARDRAATRAQDAWRRWAGPAAAAIVVAAGVVRLAHLDRLSLWLDEGATAYYASADWARVLGLRGWYDLHPPLYFALAKLAALVAPEALAGRLVSALAGTLTVAVVYALAARLVPRPVALVAAALLALSPLHIRYSQEARMYALATLLVALSYLALVAFEQTEGTAARWWVALYAISTLLALYTVYSAAYTLLPQAFLLARGVRRGPRRAAPLLVALGAVALGYLPWLPQLLGTVRAARGIASRDDYLAATPGRIADSLLSLTGLGGGLALETRLPLPWQQWRDWRAPLALGIIAVAAIGGVAIARRSGRALAIALALGAGTIAVAVAVSQVSPGYADRTIVAATLGWALLAGAAALAVGRRPRWVGATALVSLGLAVAVACASVVALDRGGVRQPYRELIGDARVAASATGLPLLPDGSWMTAFVRIYIPPPAPAQLRLAATGELLGADGRPARPDAFWLVASDYAWDRLAETRRTLADAGYARLSHQGRGPSLALELYARPDRPLGTPLPLNGTFAGPPEEAPGWALPATGARLLPAEGGGRQLVLAGGQPARIEASAGLPASPDAAYLVEYALRAAGPPGGAGVELRCRDAAGVALAATTSLGLAPAIFDGAWHAGRLAVLCPAGTARVEVAVYNGGAGELAVRDLRLAEARAR